MKKKTLISEIAPSNPALRLVLMQAFYWFAWSFGQYQTVYLQNSEMHASSSYIGTLNAVASLVAIFAMTFWGRVSDRINSIKKTFLIVLALAGVLFGAIGFLPASFKYAAAMFMIYCPIANFARGSVCTLVDNLTVRICATHRLNYGVIRSTGSFTFAVGSVLLSSLIIPAVGVKYTFLLFGVLMIPTILTVLTVPDPRVAKAPGHKKEEKKKKANPKLLFKNYYYVTFIIFALIVYIPFNSEYSFITYFMAAKGINTENLGIVLAVRAMMEIPFLIFMGKLRARFKLKYLMMVAAGFIGLECFCLGMFANSFTSVVLLCSMFGLGNGILIGTTSNYLYKLAPDELKATAHSIFGACTALSGFIGNMVGGYAMELLGAENFYLTLSGIICVGLVFFILSFIFGRNIPNPGDEMN